MFFINFKSYKSGTGEKAVKIARWCEDITAKYKTTFVSVVQTVDLFRVTSRIKSEIWVQNADPAEPFKNTGSVTPYSLKKAGAGGIFINHSDCVKEPSKIKNLTIMAKQNGLKTLIFGKNKAELLQFDHFSADYLSLEDPDLIASDTAMVDKHQELLSGLIKQIKTPLVIGAGIRTKEHYQKALALGAVGVVLSSQIMESADPKQALKELAI